LRGITGESLAEELSATFKLQKLEHDIPDLFNRSPGSTLWANITSRGQIILSDGRTIYRLTRVGCKNLQAELFWEDRTCCGPHALHCLNPLNDEPYLLHGDNQSISRLAVRAHPIPNTCIAQDFKVFEMEPYLRYSFYSVDVSSSGKIVCKTSENRFVILTEDGQILREINIFKYINIRRLLEHGPLFQPATETLYFTSGCAVYQCHPDLKSIYCIAGREYSLGNEDGVGHNALLGCNPRKPMVHDGCLFLRHLNTPNNPIRTFEPGSLPPYAPRKMPTETMRKEGYRYRRLNLQTLRMETLYFRNSPADEEAVTWYTRGDDVYLFYGNPLRIYTCSLKEDLYKDDFKSEILNVDYRSQSTFRGGKSLFPALEPSKVPLRVDLKLGATKVLSADWRVLAARSSYFKSLFESGMAETQLSDQGVSCFGIDLTHLDIPEAVMTCVLDFIQSGVFSLKTLQDNPALPTKESNLILALNATKLVEAALYFRLPRLGRLAEKFLVDHALVQDIQLTPSVLQALDGRQEEAWAHPILERIDQNMNMYPKELLQGFTWDYVVKNESIVRKLWSKTESPVKPC